MGEIKGKLPDGHCINIMVLMSREEEPHHPDTHWDRHLTRLYHYKGHLLYDSTGCYVCNVEGITSLDVLTSINDGMATGQFIPISGEMARKLDDEYMHWVHREWESQKHEFQYWLWDGKETSGPFLTHLKMTLDEARDHVMAKYKYTKYRSFDLQEFNGKNDTYYHYEIMAYEERTPMPSDGEIKQFCEENSRKCIFGRYFDLRKFAKMVVEWCFNR